MIIGQKNIIVNSTILFVIAAILEMTLNELGQFFSSIFVGAQQISLHHNYVTNITNGLPLLYIIFIKGAGLFVSLGIGILFNYICFNQKRRNILFLFNLYMSLFGFIDFFGYLMVAPIFPKNVTGFLELPLWMIYIVAIIAAIILYFIINSMMKYFVEMGSKEIVEDNAERHHFIHSIILFPCIIGIAITAVLIFPINTNYPRQITCVVSLFAILFPYKNALQKNYSISNNYKSMQELNEQNVWLYVFFILIILINRLLVSGIYIK